MCGDGLSDLFFLHPKNPQLPRVHFPARADRGGGHYQRDHLHRGGQREEYGAGQRAALHVPCAAVPDFLPLCDVYHRRHPGGKAENVPLYRGGPGAAGCSHGGGGVLRLPGRRAVRWRGRHGGLSGPERFPVRVPGLFGAEYFPADPSAEPCVPPGDAGLLQFHSGFLSDAFSAAAQPSEFLHAGHLPVSRDRHVLRDAFHAL